MKILLLLLILVPFLGGLSMMVRPIEDTHRRNVYVMCLCSAVSVAAIAMLAVFLPTASATDTVFVRIFGENFSIALHIDGLSAVFVAIVAILWPVTNLYGNVGKSVHALSVLRAADTLHAAACHA